MAKSFKNLILGPKTEYFFLFAIISNTVLLCMGNFLTAQEQRDILKSCNDILTYLFLAEMVLKILALGPGRK